MSEEARRRFGDVQWWTEKDDSGLTDREKYEQLVEGVLISSGIEKQLYCPEWTDLEVVNREITAAVVDCKNMLDVNIPAWGWTGIGLWYDRLYT